MGKYSLAYNNPYLVPTDCMPPFINKYWPYLLLLLFAIPLFGMNVHSYHQWGDDYAQYIKEAQNIAAGRPYYQSNYVFNPLNTIYGPPLYPPGFPLLLSPIILYWGLNIKAMLYLITLFLAILLFVLYSYFRKSSSAPTAVCLSVIVVYCSYIIDFKQHVLSDIPCLLCVSIYLNLRKGKELNATRIIFLACTAAMAILIRSQAILLLAAEGLWLAIDVYKRIVAGRFSPAALSPLLIIFFSAGIYFVVNKLVFHTPQDAVNYYKNFYTWHTDYAGIIYTDTLYFITLIKDIFQHSSHGFISQALVSVMSYAGLVSGILGFILVIRKRILMEDLFFMLMCLLIIITPVHEGLRFFLPAVPLYILYCKEGIYRLLKKTTQVRPYKIAILLTVIYLALGHEDYLRAAKVPDYIWSPNTRNDTVAFQYLIDHTGKDDIILFAKPRALTLYTNKRAMVIAYTASLDVAKKQIDSMHIKYLLWRLEVSEPFFKNYLRYSHSAVDSYKINDFYTLYKLR